jgi:hypothetical protein
MVRDMTQARSNMVFEVLIRKSTRDYGYIFWNQTQDEDAKRFFGELVAIRLWIDGSYVGEKQIDWKSRRIYVGVGPTKNLSRAATTLRLEFCGDSEVRVVSH